MDKMFILLLAGYIATGISIWIGVYGMSEMVAERDTQKIARGEKFLKGGSIFATVFIIAEIIMYLVYFYPNM